MKREVLREGAAAVAHHYGGVRVNDVLRSGKYPRRLLKIERYQLVE